jgi:hypothetical protein
MSAAIFTCFTEEERLLPHIFLSGLPVKVKEQRLGPDNSILAKSDESLCIAKMTSVSLDMFRIYVSLTVQLRIAKTIQPAKGRKGLCIIISITAKGETRQIQIGRRYGQIQ